MTFKELYDRILPLWPSKIDISDGMILEPMRSFKKLNKEKDSNDYFYSQNLSSAWEDALKKIEENNVFEELMVWSIWQLINVKARSLFEQKINIIEPAALNKVEIESQLFKNLQEDTYEKELAEYERILE